MPRFSMTSPNALDTGAFPPPPRGSTTPEAASFPASARPDVPNRQGEHPCQDETPVPGPGKPKTFCANGLSIRVLHGKAEESGDAALAAAAERLINAEATEQDVRDVAAALHKAGKHDHGNTLLRQVLRPSDFAITYAQRVVLERVSQGLQLGDLATDEVVGPLLDADLLTEHVKDGRLVGWGLTELGEAVLGANRSLLPEGWRMTGVLGGLMRHYAYAGRLGNASVTASDADPLEYLETSLELAEARVALYRHLLSQTKGGAR